MAQVQVRRLGYALGAAVTGVDLRHPLDDAAVAEIRRAWLEHLVLCFPNQNLDKESQLVEFASRFGEVDAGSPVHDRDAGNPAIILLSNKPKGDKPWDGKKQGVYWHSDSSFTFHPNLGTMALAKELPEVGGDTLFANQYMAYETLSATMRGIVDGLNGVHHSDLLTHERPIIVHPIVRIHPETGRKALYIGDVQKRVSVIEGMTEEESRPLLDFLIAHATRYELSYRHRWSVNDLVLWDNRCLLHYAIPDFDQRNQPRHLWRCALRGEKMGYLYDPAKVGAPALQEVSG